MNVNRTDTGTTVWIVFSESTLGESEVSAVYSNREEAIRHIKNEVDDFSEWTPWDDGGGAISPSGPFDYRLRPESVFDEYQPD